VVKKQKGVSMIYDELKNLKNYSAIIPGYEAVKKALEEIEKTNFELGDFKTDDSKVHYLKSEFETAIDKLYECHDYDIDIQMLYEGEEKVTTGEYSGQVNYDENGNVFNLECKELTSVKLIPNHFALFFPHEMHCPGLALTAPSTVKKIVFKIRTK
jgi:YhcH/YjgK/YiaL family protein